MGALQVGWAKEISTNMYAMLVKEAISVATESYSLQIEKAATSINLFANRYEEIEPGFWEYVIIH